MNNIFRRINVEQHPKQLYKEDFTEYLLCLALDVGEGMLRNGGEIGRVEDTIERICRAYGALHVEVFTIISVINAAIRMPDGSYSSQLRRVKSTSTNLSVLEDLNALSRKICAHTPALEDFDEMISEIKRRRAYPRAVIISASAITVGAFTIFFGGGVTEAFIAMLIGAIMSLIDGLPTKRLNFMAKTVFSSFTAAILALLSVKFGIGNNPDAIIIGALMLLVPGLAFGTALRDLLCGDLLAGTLKTLQAFLAALMIAFGYVLAATLAGGV